MQPVDYLILGRGLTAQYLIGKIQSKEPSATIVSTSRNGSPHTLFDLNDSTTWSNLPEAKVTFWTFPPEPIDRVEQFANSHLKELGQVVVLGSTSCLVVNSDGEKVDESTPRDESIERVRAESSLKDQGAILVLSSGQYSQERNPISWVEKGYVGKNPKWVNMIHLEDLAEFLWAAAKRGKAGKLYIASDNNPQQWDQIISLWESKGILKDIPIKSSHKTSKRINCTSSLKTLQVSLRYQNFADSVS